MGQTWVWVKQPTGEERSEHGKDDEREWRKKEMTRTAQLKRGKERERERERLEYERDEENERDEHIILISN